MAAFKAAMELAYGPLSVNGDDDSWQPPALPTQPGRQLWTDAFAVLNFITLAKSSSSPREADLWSSRAKKLVQSVHNTLEEKNSDASQSTQGTVTDGLRSGNDGQAGPVSDGLALILWMFALNRYSIYTNDKTYNDVAIQLAKGEGMKPTHTRDFQSTLEPYAKCTIFTLLQRTAGSNSSILRSEIDECESIISSTSSTEAPFKSDNTLEIGMALWLGHFLKDTHEWSRKLSQNAFTSINVLQRSRYFALSTFEDDIESGKRVPYFKDFSVALGIRCYDYSKSSAVWEGIADNIMLAYGGDLEGGVLASHEAGNKATNLVMYAAAVEPGAFKDGFIN